MRIDVTRTALRLGLGTGCVFTVGVILNWPVPFLAAVFAAMFLQAPKPPPVSNAIGLVLIALGLMGLSWMAFTIFLPYPVLFLVIVFVAVTVSFNAAAKSAPPLVVILALLASLLVPFLVLTSRDITFYISLWIPGNLAIALFATWLAFTILPSTLVPQPNQNSEGQNINTSRRILRMSLVALPFTALFFLLEGGSALTLIFVAILAQQLAATTSSGPTVALAMLAANAVGGFAAVIAYEIVVMAPSLGIMVLATFTLTFFFAAQSVSERPSSALAGSALVAALVLFGRAMAPFGDDAETKNVRPIMANIVSAGLHSVRVCNCRSNYSGYKGTACSVALLGNAFLCQPEKAPREFSPRMAGLGKLVEHLCVRSE